MSALDRVLPRSAVKLNVPSLWAWGPEPKRIVWVVLLERPEGLVAQVVGHDGAGFVLLDERPALGTERYDVRLADGTTWTLVAARVCCGSKLKGFHPLRSDVRDARS